jgi:hypothetical protein
VPDPTGRRRTPGRGRYVAGRHHHAGAPPARLRTGLLAAIAGLIVADVVLGGLAVHATRTGAAPAAPLPVITFPPAITGVSPSPAPRGAERQLARTRPAVLLGPADLAASLTAYCLDRVNGAVAAGPGSDTWVCVRTTGGPYPIAMNVACAWLYGPDAWAGMLDDNDPQTWRCYHDPS